MAAKRTAALPMIYAVLGIGIPFTVALGGAIFSFGKLTQTVSDLKTKFESIGMLETKVDNLAERISALEAIIGERRKTDHA